MDLFSRRFYARMVSEIALRSVYSLNPFFEDFNKGALFNRYFDILIVHKTVPYLLVGGFTTVLQAGFWFSACISLPSFVSRFRNRACFCDLDYLVSLGWESDQECCRSFSQETCNREVARGLGLLKRVL